MTPSPVDSPGVLAGLLYLAAVGLFIAAIAGVRNCDVLAVVAVIVLHLVVPDPAGRRVYP